MFNSNNREEKAQQLFSFLALNNGNNNETSILNNKFKIRILNSIKYELSSESFPMFGGGLLKSIDVILEIVELMKSVII